MYIWKKKEIKLQRQIKSLAIFQATSLNQMFFEIFIDDFWPLVSLYYIINLIQLFVQSLLNCLFFIFKYYI